MRRPGSVQSCPRPTMELSFTSMVPMAVVAVLTCHASAESSQRPAGIAPPVAAGASSRRMRPETLGTLVFAAGGAQAPGV